MSELVQRNGLHLLIDHLFLPTLRQPGVKLLLRRTAAQPSSRGGVGGAKDLVDASTGHVPGPRWLHIMGILYAYDYAY